MSLRKMNSPCVFLVIAWILIFNFVIDSRSSGYLWILSFWRKFALGASTNTKKLFFTRLCPPLVTTTTSNVDACFSKTHFGSFHAKAPKTRSFFAISMKRVLSVVCCWNVGLIFRLMASWWQFSFRTLFRASTTLNWTILSPWHREWCRSI